MISDDPPKVQHDLFSGEPVKQELPIHVGVEPKERPRLKKQAEDILQRLKRGPVSNRELSRHYALNYQARICELRKHFDIRIVKRSAKTGLVIYELVGEI